MFIMSPKMVTNVICPGRVVTGMDLVVSDEAATLYQQAFAYHLVEMGDLDLLALSELVNVANVALDRATKMIVAEMDRRDKE
jgi:hypothetical protein